MSHVSFLMVGSVGSRMENYVREARKYDADVFRVASSLPSIQKVIQKTGPDDTKAILFDRSETARFAEAEFGKFLHSARKKPNLFFGVVGDGDDPGGELTLPASVHEVPGDEEQQIELIIWSCSTQFEGAEDLDDEARSILEAPWQWKTRQVYARILRASERLEDRGDSARQSIREALRSPVLTQAEAVVLSGLRSCLDKFEHEGGRFFRSEEAARFFDQGAALLRGAPNIDEKALQAWLHGDVQRLGLDSWLDDPPLDDQPPVRRQFGT